MSDFKKWIKTGKKAIKKGAKAGVKVGKFAYKHRSEIKTAAEILGVI